MKGKRIFGMMIGLVLAAAMLPAGLSDGALTVAAAGNEYSVSSFSGLPANWALYGECDTGKSSATAENGELVIKHDTASNPGASKYYGAMYHIATDRTWSDFTFEMTFRMTEPANDSRWMGVVFHRVESGNNAVGYLVNYRYNGATAASAISSSRKFADEANDQGPALSDGAYHTMTVQMSGTTIRNYMDDQLTKTWDASIKNATVGGSVLASGGFSLIVNCATVQIRSIRITDDVTGKTVPTTDDKIVNTYQAQTKIINAPTVVCDVNGLSVFQSMTEGKRLPSNALLRYDRDGDIVDEDGNVIGAFPQIYQRLNHKIIPVLVLSDEAGADALIGFLKKEVNILDLAVMSENPALVKRVKESCPHVRGIISFSGENFQSDYDIVKTVNSNYANVALLPLSAATKERVEYIQARFKTVWVLSDDDSEISLQACVSSGAYGFVTDNFEAAYDVLEAYPACNVRPIFNVAHRGLPNRYNENSLSGTRAAIACGATHVELDGKVTTDGKILMMHDDDIGRTSNGKGNIEKMTYEQARQYKLDLFEPKDEKIPDIDEIMDALKGTNTVLVFEIKTSKEAIIQPLKEAIERHDFWDQIVVIAFDTAQLVRMKATMPEVPTANLNTANQASFAACLKWMGEWNTGVDVIHSQTNVEFNQKYLRDRGIVGWYWTFSGYSQIKQAEQNGYVGVTNNDADTFGEEIKGVNAADMRDVESVPYVEGETIALALALYNGTESEVQGRVVGVQDYGEYYGILASYTVLGENPEDDRIFYTGLIKAYKAETAVETPFYQQAWFIVLCVAGGVVVLGGICLLIKKKIGKAEKTR